MSQLTSDSDAEHPLGAILREFRPTPANVNAGYLTAWLLLGSGLGLIFEMMRQLIQGAEFGWMLLGGIVGGVVTVIGKRVLTGLRHYDELAFRVCRLGLEVETAELLERATWSALDGIDELTLLDGAAPASEEAIAKPGLALMLRRNDGWCFPLDHNRIAEFHEMRELVRQLATDAQVPWRQVHQLEDHGD
ncbi:MAG: hypothetical protein KDB14_25730 [Planctomycetales bacterium]|nr:hypothetical protein [Planctomycetales bacterium]